MIKQDGINSLVNAAAFFDKQGSGYKSWGKVSVLQAAIKVDSNSYLITDEKLPLENATAQNIQLVNTSTGLFSQLFGKRKEIQIILITKQQYASQVRTEIPAILDDQAQLLGVSVRIAKSSADIMNALSGRFAAILPDGKSICVGGSMDDAYVAAQLLEKTSKVFIEAEVLGGAKPINKIEAWVMQKYYQYKYSKEANKNK